MNASDIKANSAALAAAAAKDWAVCRDALRAVSVTAAPRRCGSKESAIAVMQAGGNHVEMMEKLCADKTGNLLYLRLADGSREGGVVWAEPDLTVSYMQSRVKDFTQPVIDALVQLSAPVSYPHASVTAEQCQAVWQVEVESEELQALQNLRAGFQTRFDSIKNQFGTSEQSLGAAALRAMADEWEAA